MAFVIPAIAAAGAAIGTAASSAGAAVGIGSAAAGTAASVGGAATLAAVPVAADAIGTGAGIAGGIAAGALPAAATVGGTIGATGTAASIGSGVLGNLSLASSALGALSGGLGTYISAQASSKAAKFNAQVASENSKAAKQNAAIAGQAGAEQAAVTSQKTKALVGSMISNEGASGVDVNSGSALESRISATEVGDLDTLTVRSNATKEAYGYKTQSENFENESNLDKLEAESASTGGEIGTASTFLGGIGDVGTNWYKYQLSGGFGS